MFTSARKTTDDVQALMLIIGQIHVFRLEKKR